MRKEALDAVTSIQWADRTFLTVVLMFAAGAAARVLVSGEPFNMRRFVAEMLFAFIGAVMLWSFGLLQGMTALQIIFFGSLGSLGGVRLIEWGIKIAKAVGKD